jgi:predicted naringenin-chalcone synthase
MVNSSVFINQISTSVPPHDVHQRFVDYIPELIKEPREVAIFNRLSHKAQIKARYSFLRPSTLKEELDDEGFYVKGRFPSTAKRMEKYKQNAFLLAKKALEPLFENVSPDVITHVVITSCTGSYAPGLDLEMVKALGLKPHVERTMIGFMGCYAAINGLKAAYHIVRSQPQAKFILVNIELCTLHLQEKADFESLLSFLQFADGCAASLISAKPSGLEIVDFHCELIPENEEQIQWHIGDSGFEMKLSLEVPKSLGRKLLAMAPQLKNENKIWAIHPGGRSVLDAALNNLNLHENDLRHSRSVLADYGNMSSATVCSAENSDRQRPGRARSCYGFWSWLKP